MRDREQIRCLKKMLFGPHLNKGILIFYRVVSVECFNNFGFFWGVIWCKHYFIATYSIPYSTFVTLCFFRRLIRVSQPTSFRSLSVGASFVAPETILAASMFRGCHPIWVLFQSIILLSLLKSNTPVWSVCILVRELSNKSWD